MPTLKWVTTKYIFDADGDLPTLRDKRKNKFSPINVIITHRTDLGFWHVRVYGHKTCAGTSGTEAIFGIQENRALPNGIGRAPDWVQDLVDQAVAMHAGGESCG
jgi:hypothetical protein